MPSFAFTNTIFLYGLALVALPPVIHLLFRQKKRKLDFSTLRFLKAIDTHTARRHRLTDLLAMLLRMLAIALFALALARPILKTASPEKAIQQTASWAVVLDDSYSMGYAPGGGDALFAEAQKAVVALTRRFKAEDEAALFLTGGRSAEDFDAMSRDFAAMASVVERLTVSDSHRGVFTAMKAGLDELAKTRRGSKVMVVATDFQRWSWHDFAAIEQLEWAKNCTHLYLLDLGVGAAPNSYIDTLRVIQPSPFPSMKVAIKATIRNESGQNAAEPISIFINDKLVSRQEYVLASGDSTIISIDYSPQTAGDYFGVAQIGNDYLERDNVRHFHFVVADAIPILLVDGDLSPYSNLSGAQFIAAALQPFQTVSASRNPSVQLDIVKPGEVNPLRLRQYEIIIAVNAEQLTPAALDGLEQYVREGRNLWLFAGDNAWTRGKPTPLYERRFINGAATGLADQERDGAAPLTFSDFEASHPIFGEHSSLRPENWVSAGFFRYLVVQRDSLGKSSSILASFSNGAPYVIENQLDKGTVLFFTADMDPRWTNLALRPYFLPLVHSTIKHLVFKGRNVILPLAVGDTLGLDLKIESAPKRVALLDPREQHKYFSLGKQQPRARIDGLDFAGIYEVATEYEEFTDKVRFIANIDTAESRLDRLNEQELQRVARLHETVAIHDSANALLWSIDQQRDGLSMGPLLFVLAFVMLLVESLMVNIVLPRMKAAREQAATALLMPYETKTK